MRARIKVVNVAALGLNGALHVTQLSRPIIDGTLLFTKGDHTWNKERPPRRWSDDFNRAAELHQKRLAQDRGGQRELGDTYVQKQMTSGQEEVNVFRLPMFRRSNILEYSLNDLTRRIKLAWTAFAQLNCLTNKYLLLVNTDEYRHTTTKKCTTVENSKRKSKSG